jgi:predicted RNA-binding protein with TRAM domain
MPMLSRPSLALVAMIVCALPAHAAEEFPFGLEMTLDTAPMPGSKRRPNIEVGDAGEAQIELFCKGGKGQFSVAGNTVVFVAGVMETRSCTPAQVAADDALLSSLSEVDTWSRRGDVVTFNGPKPLRFRLNTN